MTIEEIVQVTRQQLTATQSARDNAQTVVDSLHNEMTRLQRALNALEPKAKPKQAKPNTKKGKKVVSEAMVDRVRRAVEASPEPITVSAMTPMVGASQSAVNAALQILRDREEVRLAGKAPTQGAPSLWASMKRR